MHQVMKTLVIASTFAAIFMAGYSLGKRNALLDGPTEIAPVPADNSIASKLSTESPGVLDDVEILVETAEVEHQAETVAVEKHNNLPTPDPRQLVTQTALQNAHFLEMTPNEAMSQIRNQDRDADWAPKQEARIREAFETQLKQKTAGLMSLECRTEQCYVEVYLDSPASTLGGMLPYIHAIRSLGQGPISMSDPNDSNRVLFVIDYGSPL
ncbi:MAG: hypothetical protein AB8F65_15015 [Woeseiaceae bacterium]